MGGTLSRDEWLKLKQGERERAMAPRRPGNVVIPLAHQMTEEERLGKHSPAKPVQNCELISSATETSR